MARKEWRVGDQVRCDTAGGLEGAEGTIQYIGRVGDKPAIYVGIELLPSFHGQGKNDGSVNGYVLHLHPRLFELTADHSGPAISHVRIIVAFSSPLTRFHPQWSIILVLHLWRRLAAQPLLHPAVLLRQGGRARMEKEPSDYSLSHRHGRRHPLSPMDPSRLGHLSLPHLDLEQPNTKD